MIHGEDLGSGKSGEATLKATDGGGSSRRRNMMIQKMTETIGAGRGPKKNEEAEQSRMSKKLHPCLFYQTLRIPSKLVLHLLLLMVLMKELGWVLVSQHQVWESIPPKVEMTLHGT